MRASRALLRPWIYPPETPEAWATYIAKVSGPAAAGFLPCRRSDGAITGYITISEIIRGGLQSAFIGYAAVSEFAGQGYMTEAMRLVLAQAFGPLGLHRLEANIQPGNLASKALAAKVGFEKEGFSPQYLQVGGVWCDHERWAARAA